MKLTLLILILPFMLSACSLLDREAPPDELDKAIDTACVAHAKEAAK